MRGDGVGVGDIGAVLDRAGGPKYSEDGDHGGGKVSQPVGGVFGGRGRAEGHDTEQPCWDWHGIGDGAWCKPGAGGDDGDGTDRSHGMRGDGVGVGDIGPVLDRAWGPGHAAGGDYGGRAGR